MELSALYKFLLSAVKMFLSIARSPSCNHQVDFVIRLTPFQEIFHDIETPSIRRPNHLLPRLKPTTRGCNRKTPRFSMQALPLNWENLVRSNRPFEPLEPPQRFYDARAAPPPQLPRIPLRPHQLLQQRLRGPTAYYMEQAPFYEQNYGQDPFATEPEEVELGPLKMVVCTIVRFLAMVAIPSWRALVGASLRLRTCARVVAYCSLVCLKLVYGWTKCLDLEVVFMMVVALQVVKLLPGWSGERAVIERPLQPLYTMYVSRHEAIGHGPVSMREQ